MVQKIVDPKFHIKTFNVKCDTKLSPLAKTILSSFKFKLYYYVIDDLLYLLKSNLEERDYLLQILNSSVIFLQNNLYVNFFDIFFNSNYYFIIKIIIKKLGLDTYFR